MKYMFLTLDYTQRLFYALLTVPGKVDVNQKAAHSPGGGGGF
jgi:hypothetical protein